MTKDIMKKKKFTCNIFNTKIWKRLWIL